MCPAWLRRIPGNPTKHLCSQLIGRDLLPRSCLEASKAGIYSLPYGQLCAHYKLDIVSKKEEKGECWVKIYQLMASYFGLCYSKFPSNYKTPMVLGFALAPCRSAGHVCD